MSAAILFDLAAAEAAEGREENGVAPLPGDRELIAALDGWRQQEWDAYWEPIHAAEYAEWQATQCSACVEGGTGPVCDDCAEEVA